MRRREKSGNAASRANFGLDDVPLTNPVAVGDQVQVQEEPSEAPHQGIIDKILPRRNYVVRQSPRRKHDLHLLAANIDQAVLIVTVVHPNLKPGFIDRFLVMTERDEIPATIIFNKADLYTEEDLAVYAEMKAVYNKIGYGTSLTSVAEGGGLDAFPSAAGRQNHPAQRAVGGGQKQFGQCGTAPVGAAHGRHQRLLRQRAAHHHFCRDVRIGFWGAHHRHTGHQTIGFRPTKDKHNIAHKLFREFFRLSEQCRFGGQCLHVNEPGCAVHEALRQGEVSELRYTNYLTLLDEVEDQHYWEQHREY